MLVDNIPVEKVQDKRIDCKLAESCCAFVRYCGDISLITKTE